MREKTNNIGKFYLPNDRAGEMYCENEEWEPITRETFRQYLHEESNVLDIGAHVAYHTVSLAKLCPAGKVYAFEPNRSVLPFAEMNIRENGCDNVILYPVAVSDNDGESYFTENPNTFLNSLTSDETGALVKTIAVDSLMSTLPKIDLIKIDVEGFEIPALKGAFKLIKRDRPTIVIEIWEHKVAEYIKYLSSIGYALIFTGSGSDENYVAVPFERFIHGN